MALAVTALGLAACGDDDADESDVSGNPAESTEEIVIETHLTFPLNEAPRGEILEESTIGGSPFCPGGTFSDQPGSGQFFNEKTIECDDGSLEIGFSPGEPSNRTQKGPWEVLSSTGAYEGLQASGEMEAKFDSQTEGHETFTGTVSQ
ncbi:MAG: hypothetical protein M3355_07790 [Actinomycetota bacterium]|nr:hypothetical protein [Actinomycetota bacterium]